MTSRRTPARPPTPRRRFDPRRIVAIAVATATLAGFGIAASPVIAADGTVTIKDNVFQPAAVSVGVNETVTWSNLGARNHTVTADDGSFDSGPLEPGDAFATVFPTAGSFPYHCAIHPTMRGTITVGAGAPAASVSVAPVTTPPGTLPPSFSPVPTQVPPPSVASPSTTALASAGGSAGPAGSGGADPGAVSSTLPGVGLPAIGVIALLLVVLVALSFVVPRRRRG